MAISDVTIQDGLKHPYLLTLVRWCVSSFWTTATVILQRLIAARIPQVKAVKPRPASYGHLHPEPRVHCEVLHSPPLPEDHTLDVIFVHGLYGSLGNTWRQGEWHNKYEKAPDKVPLRRPHSVPTCKCSDEREKCCSDEIGESNAKSTPHTEIRRTSGNENYRCVDINDKNEPNSQLKRCSCGENTKLKDINVNDAPQNELNAIKCCDIEINDQIRQKNLKGDTDIRKIDCSIKTTESNHDIFDLRIPSDIKRSISDVNIRKHYNIKYTDEKINESPVNSDMYDNEHDVNIEKDYVTRSGEDIIKGDMKTNLYDHIQKILPNENLLITEKFYNNTLLDDVDIGSYETQAQFVKDLFKNSVNVKSDESESEVKASDCKCEEKCEPGCGCICDDCYSPCWPRDWIRVDYPGARVISINYTSDPYLWRPLWVKESKRLRLHERAEQMTSQLLELGVGERPIIWVGHSKGGLFIKKIYCEAYEAHLKLAKQNATKEEFSEETNEQNTTECRNDNEINHCRDKMMDKENANVITDENSNENENNDIENQIEKIYEHIQPAVVRNDEDIEMNKEIVNSFEENSKNGSIMYKNSKHYEKQDLLIAEDCDNNGNIPNFMTDNADNKENKSPLYDNAARAQLWRRSAGFMFYSVPHRGSPLADIKTPITARSVELMEICKDCPLVLSLQDSWSVATAPATPPVRSVVETCRTLMSVLYLRIVSVDSADPGIGSLYGVNVDHREICKPSSRSCLLYQELMALMEAALSKKNSQ